MHSPFLRHIEACNSQADLAGFLPWRIGAHTVGWLRPEVAEDLAAQPGFTRAGEGLALTPASHAARSRTLASAARALGRWRERGELFDVRATPESPSLAVLDRGAIPGFGVIGQGVHLNGLVRRADGLHVWIGWRAKDKPVAPGQLDNIVAGGTPAGHTPETCLLKEAEEEASIPEELARMARAAGHISYMMAQPDGSVRRDVMHLFDLELPEDFTPKPNDDEVERFELWPARRVLEFVRDTDEVKFNVNLVIIDLALREGLIDPEGAEGRMLRSRLRRPLG